MKKLLTLFAVFLIFSINTNAVNTPEKKADIERIEYYRHLFGDKCLNDKITDNFGNGYDSLYGTRNMRVVLHGVAYRGGANNFYHKTNKRDNNNPLPPDGLKRLAEFGFSACYYLYATNYKESETLYINSRNDTLKYEMNTLPDEKSIHEVIKSVYNNIYDSTAGPIYLHCWNGWHQSGMISAILLKQFCRFSSEEAVDYWVRNTDGNSRGYERIKKRISDFKPIEQYNIGNEERNSLCPCKSK